MAASAKQVKKTMQKKKTTPQEATQSFKIGKKEWEIIVRYGKSGAGTILRTIVKPKGKALTEKSPHIHAMNPADLVLGDEFSLGVTRKRLCKKYPAGYDITNNSSKVGSIPAETDMELSVNEREENLEAIHDAAMEAEQRGAFSVMATGNDSSTGAINQDVTPEQRKDAEQAIQKANPDRMGTKGTNKSGKGPHISGKGFYKGRYRKFGKGPSN